MLSRLLGRDQHLNWFSPILINSEVSGQNDKT